MSPVKKAKRVRRRRRLDIDVQLVCEATHVERSVVDRVLNAYWKIRYKAARVNCEEAGHTFGRHRSMSEDQIRSALDLYYVDGVSYEDVAARLGLPKTTVVRSMKRYREENQLWRRALVARGSLREGH
jgi:DNA-directed RNA polymerase specialized sigma24 family protein